MSTINSNKNYITKLPPLLQLLCGSLVYGVGSVLVQLINILLLPILTKYLSTKEYGIVAILNFASLFLVAIFSVGISTSISLFYVDQETKAKQNQLTYSALTLLFVAVVLMLLIAWPTVNIWSNLLLTSSEHSIACRYMLLASAVTILTLPLDSRIRLDMRPIAFSLASLISSLSIGFLTIYFVIVLKLGVVGFFKALLYGRLIAFICFYVISLTDFRISVSGDLIKKLVYFGLPIIPQFAFLYILQYGNIEALKRLVNLEAAGVYSVGFTIGFASNIVVSSIANAWAPFFLSYSKKLKDAETTFGSISSYYLFGVGVVSIIFYYLSQPLIMILAVSSYHQAYIVVGPTATAMFVFGMYNLLLPPIYFAKQTSKLNYFLLAAVVLQVILGIIIIPNFNILGAAVVQIVAYLILNLGLFLWNRSQKNYLKIQYEWKRVFIFAIFYLLSIILLILVSNLQTIKYLVICSLHFISMLAVVWYLLYSSEKLELIKILSRSRF